MTVSLAVGTVKGLFVLRSDDARRDFAVEGPVFKGWKATAFCRAPSGGYLAATSSFVYGATVHHSTDLVNWKPLEAPPKYAAESGFKLNEIWTLVSDGRRVFAGVDEAGLFVSEDSGRTWRLVEGLTAQPHRKGWFPGFGGLCCHTVLVDPRRPSRITVGISAVGAFRSEDDGATWTSKNDGVEIICPDQEHAEIGWCVHRMVHDPADPDAVWRQDHKGVYRSRDGGDRWERIENGLPSGFGFPLGRDPVSGALYVVPLEADEYRMPVGGRLAVYRSTDGGTSWSSASNGLPEHFMNGVLRGALATDGLAASGRRGGGVYFGTTAGTFHWSSDGGDSWRSLPHSLPRVTSVAAFVD